MKSSLTSHIGTLKYFGLMLLSLTILAGFSVRDVKAQEATEQTPLSVTQVLENLNNWLTQDNNAGITLVNESLKKAHDAATTCDTGSFLQRFDFSFDQEDKGPSREFTFAYSSVNEYKPDCEYTWFFGQSSEGLYPPLERVKYGIFRVPVRLRDLVPALLEDKELMAQLAKLFGEKAHVSVDFSLAKNKENQLAWTVVFTDENSANVYKVRTMANSVETVDFSLFKGE